MSTPTPPPEAPPPEAPQPATPQPATPQPTSEPATSEPAATSQPGVEPAPPPGPAGPGQGSPSAELPSGVPPVVEPPSAEPPSAELPSGVPPVAEPPSAELPVVERPPFGVILMVVGVVLVMISVFVVPWLLVTDPEGNRSLVATFSSLALVSSNEVGSLDFTSVTDAYLDGVVWVLLGVVAVAGLAATWPTTWPTGAVGRRLALRVAVGVIALFAVAGHAYTLVNTYDEFTDVWVEEAADADSHSYRTDDHAEADPEAVKIDAGGLVGVAGYVLVVGGVLVGPGRVRGPAPSGPAIA